LFPKNQNPLKPEKIKELSHKSLRRFLRLVRHHRGWLAWWPGDGNANDIVGGNNGTLVGGVSFVPGEVGQAFSFDGATGYVQIPSSSVLQPPSAISIDAWVYPTAFPPPTDPASVIVSKYDSANGGGFSWALLMQPTGQVEWYVIGPSEDPSSQIEVVTVGALSLAMRRMMSNASSEVAVSVAERGRFISSLVCTPPFQ
jgi:hypothetical protein